MDIVEITDNANRHPWELSRTNCLLQIVKKYKLSDVYDIGAGDCYFTHNLLSVISGTIYAVDKGFTTQKDHAKSIQYLNSISELPCRSEKVGVLLMDVIEHVEDDSEFLKEIICKIPVGSFVLITVPAYQFLFSGHDKYLQHYRRYNKKQILNLIAKYNVQIHSSHYFYFILFLFRCVSKILSPTKFKSIQSNLGLWQYTENNIITKIIKTVLNIDFNICKTLANLKIYLPGLSYLILCEKKT